MHMGNPALQKLQETEQKIRVGQFDSQSFMVAEDLASFYISSEVIIGKVNSVSALKHRFADNPEMEELVDAVLAAMEKENVIEVLGDTIVAQVDVLEANNDPRLLLQYLPNLFRVASKRVILNQTRDPLRRKRRKEGVRYFVIPDDPEIASEAKAIQREFTLRMHALLEKSVRKRDADGCRFVGVVNTALDPEDFI